MVWKVTLMSGDKLSWGPIISYHNQAGHPFWLLQVDQKSIFGGCGGSCRLSCSTEPATPGGTHMEWGGMECSRGRRATHLTSWINWVNPAGQRNQWCHTSCASFFLVCVSLGSHFFPWTLIALFSSPISMTISWLAVSGLTSKLQDSTYGLLSFLVLGSLPHPLVLAQVVSTFGSSTWSSGDKLVIQPFP